MVSTGNFYSSFARCTITKTPLPVFISMKIVFKISLALLLIAYFFISFKRYNVMMLDGDMAPIIMPSPAYAQVLKDPFGINVLLTDTSYPATNRFFIHYTFSNYFKTVPNLLQSFASPLDSVYLSCALAKLLIHIFLIYIIANCF